MYGLAGYKILKKIPNGNSILLEVEVESDPPKCQCGREMARNGTKNLLIRDTSNESGIMVGARVTRWRYRCGDCNKSFFPPLAGVHENHRMTQRLVAYIEEQAAKRSCSDVADELGLSEKTIQRIFNATSEERIAALGIATPERLGIDEIHVADSDIVVLVNLDESTIVEMLPSRDSYILANCLRSMVGKPELSGVIDWDETGKDNSGECPIKAVAMDFWPAYRRVVRETLGDQCTIVVDKFHAIAKARHAMEAARKEVREEAKSRLELMKGDRHLLFTKISGLDDEDLAGRDDMLKEFPLLAQCYAAYTAFESLWDSENSNKDNIEEKLDQWEQGVGKDARRHFKKLFRAIDSWKNEIVAHFATGITNAATESFMKNIRRLSAAAQDYSFKTLRRRVMLNHAFRKKQRQYAFKAKSNIPKNACCLTYGSGFLPDFNPIAQAGDVVKDMGADIDLVIEDLMRDQRG